MSDRDLKLNPEHFIDQTFKEIKLVVHAVEQFEDGFIFDLCSDDDNTIRKSFTAINELLVHIQNLVLLQTIRKIRSIKSRRICK